MHTHAPPRRRTRAWRRRARATQHGEGFGLLSQDFPYGQAVPGAGYRWRSTLKPLPFLLSGPVCGELMTTYGNVLMTPLTEPEVTVAPVTVQVVKGAIG